MPLVDNAFYVQGSTGVTVVDLGSNSNSAGATVTITPVTIPAGALICVVASEVTSASAGTCADGTNTPYLVAVSGAMSAAAGFGTFFYFANAAAVTAGTITYTKQTSGRICSIAAFYVTGILAASPLDATTTTSTAVNSATPTVTSGTPTQASEFIVGACAYSNAAAKTLTNTGSFVTPFANVTTQATASCGGGHLNVNGSLAVTYTPTLSGASDNRTMVVGFKLATTTLIGWWNVTAWAASTTKVAGAIVRQNATPNLNAERVFVCINSVTGTGQTAASEPAWSTVASVTRGVKFTDNNVTWQEITGVTGVNGDSTNTPNWTTVKASAPAVLGQVITGTAAGTPCYFICTTAGTMGAAEPTWPAYTTTGATVTETAAVAVWTNINTVASATAWAAPHARIQNSFTATWGAAGNKFYVADNHSEVQASTNAITTPGTAAAPVAVNSVDHTLSVPPTTVLAGATIANTGTTPTLSISRHSYWYGFSFSQATTTGVATLGFAVDTAEQQMIFDTCKCFMNALSATAILQIGQSAGSTVGHKVRFLNTTVKFGNAGQQIKIGGVGFEWLNTLSAIDSAGVAPTTLFLFGFSSYVSVYVFLQGVDLSFLGAGKTIFGTGQICPQTTMLVDCKLGASVTVTAAPISGSLGRIDVIRSDNAATNYQQQRYDYRGTLTPETTIVRTGGASDGTTPISHKIVSTANSKWTFPFESIPIAIWVNTTGSHQVTIYGTTTGGGVPNNDDIWIEAEYLGDASTPQGSFATTTKASNLAASTTTNNSSDASTWGGGGAGNGFKMVTPAFTVNQVGYLYVTVKVAKATATYYIDPLIVVS